MPSKPTHIYSFEQTIALDRTQITLEDFDNVVEKVREVAYPTPNVSEGTIKVVYEIEVNEDAPVPSTWAEGFRIAAGTSPLTDGRAGSPSQFVAGFALAEMVREIEDDLSTRGFTGDLIGVPTFTARTPVKS